MVGIYKEATQTGRRFPASPSDPKAKLLKPFTVVTFSITHVSPQRTDERIQVETLERPKVSANPNETCQIFIEVGTEKNPDFPENTR
jgi:hypothetical protein